MKTNVTNRKEMLKHVLRSLSKPVGMLMSLVILGVSGINAQQAIPSIPATIHSENMNDHELRGPVMPPPVMPVTPSPIQFCPTIGSVKMIDKSFDKVCLGWDNILNFDSIMFRYTETGTTNYRTITISGTPNPGTYFIQGLVALTSYDFEVSSKCLSGFTSNWSHPLTLTTFAEPAPRIGGEENLRNANSIVVNPNPATNQSHTKISFSAAANVMHQVTIISPNGREYLRTQVSSPDGKIQMKVDLSTFPPGLYFVQVQSGINYIAGRLIVQ